jgi:hypothetical protein
MDNESGDYLSVNAKENRLNLADVYDLDDNALWAFASTGRQNEFKVYNCAHAGYISNKEGKNVNYLYITEDIKPLTVIYDSEKNAVVLFDGEKYLRKQSSNVNLGTKSNALYWSLELVSLEEDKELADIITIVEGVLAEGDVNADCYDLSGHKVENPGKGIYIQNGKKVLIK